MNSSASRRISDSGQAVGKFRHSYRKIEFETHTYRCDHNRVKYIKSRKTNNTISSRICGESVDQTGDVNFRAIDVSALPCDYAATLVTGGGRIMVLVDMGLEFPVGSEPEEVDVVIFVFAFQNDRAGGW